MISSLVADIAPSQSHISLRRNGVCYYAPELFHLSPTFDHVVPMTISDVLKSKCVLEIYGVPGIKKHMEGFVMVNNYPVQLIRIRGRLLLYNQVSYEGKLPFYVLKLDDYLGDRLSITVKASCTLLGQQLSEGVIIEVTGKVNYLPRYIQIHAKSALVRGAFSQFEIELEWWEMVLRARKFLEVPWSYQAASKESSPGLVKFLLADVIRKKQKRAILLSSGDDDDEDISFVDADDSMIVSSRKGQSNADQSQTPVFINISDDEETPIL